MAVRNTEISKGGLKTCGEEKRREYEERHREACEGGNSVLVGK